MFDLTTIIIAEILGTIILGYYAELFIFSLVFNSHTENTAC